MVHNGRVGVWAGGPPKLPLLVGVLVADRSKSRGCSLVIPLSLGNTGPIRGHETCV